MVSLVRNPNTSGSGAVFFDTSINMDDEEYLQPVFTSQEETFQKLNTVPLASIPLLFGVALEIAGIVFVSVWPEEQSKCDTYFIYLYLQCIYWLMIMVIDHVIKAKHHRLRICGYLNFYQSTYRHIRTPLFVASLWNTAYLLLAVILHHTHKDNYENYCRSSEWFTPINYIFLLTTLELVIIIPTYINYIKRVVRFNALHPPPDVANEDWMSSFLQDSYAGNVEVGFSHREPTVYGVQQEGRIGGFMLEELLERQADLIRYLKDHNAKLCHRIMALVAQRTLSRPT